MLPEDFTARRCSRRLVVAVTQNEAGAEEFNSQDKAICLWLNRSGSSTPRRLIVHVEPVRFTSVL